MQSVLSENYTFSQDKTAALNPRIMFRHPVPSPDCVAHILNGFAEGSKLASKGIPHKIRV